MTLVLYHAGLSSCSQRVRLLLAERALDYESRPIDLRAHENLSPAYLAINPKGLVPALDDDGTIVVESIDILNHLDRDGVLGGSGDPLLDAADAAQTPLKTLTHEYMFRARGASDPATLPPHPDPDARPFAQAYFENGATWHARVFADVGRLGDHLAALEARLSNAAWLGGMRLSLVDLAWASTIHRLALLGWPLSTALADWYARIAARPSFATAVLDWQPPGMAAGQAAYVAQRRAAGTALGDA